MRTPSPPRLTADLRLPRILGAAAMALFAVAALWSWRAGDGVVSMLFLGFSALAVVLVAGSGHVAADGDTVSVHGLLGRHELAWDHVRRVDGSGHGTLVLHADDARLVVPPPMLWSGPDKAALRALVMHQLRQRALVVQHSRTADYRLHRNVRVKRARPGSPA